MKLNIDSIPIRNVRTGLHRLYMLPDEYIGPFLTRQLKYSLGLLIGIELYRSRALSTLHAGLCCSGPLINRCDMIERVGGDHPPLSQSVN